MLKFNAVFGDFNQVILSDNFPEDRCEQRKF